VAAGCSSDRGTDESGGTDDAASETTAAPEGGGAGDFGDLTAVCGPNEGGGEVADAGPDETQGVTADTITVGTISDPGFEGRPGLNQEIFDSGTAFVEWCNAAGGINGRQLELNLHDAAITEYQPVVQDACATDFAIVGDGAVQDNFWESTGAACGLIDIAGFSVTPEKAGDAGRDPVEARTLQPLPNAGDRLQVGPYLQVAEDFPDAITRAGVVYGDLETLVAQKDKTVDGLEQIGYEFVHESTYNILGESNWAPFAQALADDDVRFLHFVGEGENLALLLQAMQEIGYAPDVIVETTNFYDSAFVEAAGGAAEGLLIQSVFNPLEEADQYPAVQQYLDLIEAVDGKVAQLGMQSMSSWLLFAQAAKACDLEDDLTRSCVLATAASTTDWTGGGLHAPTEPGSNEPSPCYVLMQVEGDGFSRYAPDEGFDCGEESDQPYVVEVDAG
jgi:ABC-type branched-subunit amino acid transport system substrate-binding protein